MTNDKLKIVGVCSSGGHLEQMVPILEELKKDYEIVLATFDKEDAKHVSSIFYTYYLKYPTNRNFKNNFINFFKAIRIIRIQKPCLVISNGAASAVLFAFVCKTLKISFIYIEPIDRISLSTLTARILKPLRVHFIVYWESQLKSYPNRHELP